MSRHWDDGGGNKTVTLTMMSDAYIVLLFWPVMLGVGTPWEVRGRAFRNHQSKDVHDVGRFCWEDKGSFVEG